MTKVTAVYVRVSSKQQDLRSQEPDLRRWAAGQDSEVAWHWDKSLAARSTGRT